MLAFFVCLHLSATLAMCGVIWFVQVVHYPLFTRVGRDHFGEYHRSHVSLTARFFVPLMALEAVSGVALLLVAPSGILFQTVVFGMSLLVLAWLSTFAEQFPKHRLLSRGFRSVNYESLVRANWVRTIAWSLRAVVLIAALGAWMAGGPATGKSSAALGSNSDVKVVPLSSVHSQEGELVDLQPALVRTTAPLMDSHETFQSTDSASFSSRVAAATRVDHLSVAERVNFLSQSPLKRLYFH